ncbi:GLPGLI family protein [Chryseobacterium gotjawalense]|uniref:GLPGLI family protein n=1 Tax=Chryseobacterium gotjawalense TaxID=3042315 RepID=A0ABY8RFY7_9FLAO|nr:GLPGLI family protein [Chryseobacterium sp. wdc7]WHF51924.1 GLPGLI family protein [Chryseobacterium sp. wdc7]
MIYHIFFIIFFTIAQIQSFHGQSTSFIYQLNYKTNNDKVENIVFYLDVMHGESVFRSEQLRSSDSLAVKGLLGGVDLQYNNKQLYVYKNIGENKVLKYVFVPIIINGVYTIPIIEKLSWKVSEERKVIQIYNCQKATTEYGGRVWEAWFTNEIPIQDGPYIFHGLPGLIVEIHDITKDYFFQLGQIKKFEWKNLYIAKSQSLITWEKFQKLQKDFYSDPFSNVNKSDIIQYDENGQVIRIDFKKKIGEIRNRILEKNNPIELNYKIDYNK